MAEVVAAECSLVLCFIKFQCLPILTPQFSEVDGDNVAEVVSAECSLILCFIKSYFLPILAPQFSQVDDDYEAEGDPAQHLLFPNCAQAKPSLL